MLKNSIDLHEVNSDILLKELNSRVEMMKSGMCSYCKKLLEFHACKFSNGNESEYHGSDGVYFYKNRLAQMIPCIKCSGRGSYIQPLYGNDDEYYDCSLCFKTGINIGRLSEKQYKILKIDELKQKFA